MTSVLCEEKIGGIYRVEIRPEDNFDVGKIFDCGQCFRFDRVENSRHGVEYSGVAFGRLVSFAQDGDVVYIYNSTAEDFENIWRGFLSLDTDYRQIDKALLCRCDSVPFGEAVRYGNGIRILSQDPFEAIISFIISQNNNIPRIKQIIERLSGQLGTPIDLPEEMEEHLSGKSSLCAFPTAEALNSIGIEGLFAAKTGFRAKYIYDAAEKAVAGELDYEFIRSLPTPQAIDELCKVKGIGPKVASCALLFGFEKYDAFPVDVWIKKVISKYFLTDPLHFDASDLGEYAGIAQQYLFYYERYGGYKE